jgi:two-component system OmpR family sensor kinase
VSLRARLVLGVIVLGAAGLAVADVATYTSLRGFLLDRTDRALDRSHGGVARALVDHGCRGGGGRGGGPGGGDRLLPGAESGDFVQLRAPGGVVICEVLVSGPGDEAPSPPQLPGTLVSEGGRAHLTVEAVEGGERYRVLAQRDERSGVVVVHATPLTDLDATLGRLLWIELLVTAAVLAALAALGLWVIRVALRPLDAIGATAGAIAAGDLARRVDRADAETEVGRLGLALNAMLGQIESAFRAREASESRLRRFVADASHELRTPLAAVRAYAELFGRGAEERPDDLARSMEGITREAERMTVLVDDLLLLARLDEGRPLGRDRVELADVVSEAVETARAVEPARPIELRAGSAPVLGDRDRLRQVVDNLLTNVRAHTPPGTSVSVQVERREGEAVLEVSDNGPGLTADDAGRVFERFYRADQSRARASGGVGLGLSIVAAVAEAHGGTVSLRSTPGAGATFTVKLPLAAAL